MAQYWMVGCPSKYELERALLDGKHVTFRSSSGREFAAEVYGLKRRIPGFTEDWIAEVWVDLTRDDKRSWYPCLVMFSTQSRQGLLIELETLDESIHVQRLKDFKTTELQEKLAAAKVLKQLVGVNFTNFLGGLDEHDRTMHELVRVHHETVAMMVGYLEHTFLARSRM